MDLFPVARITLRYGVGLFIGMAQGEMLAADPDIVTIAALAIGGLVEVGYMIAKRRGGAT